MTPAEAGQRTRSRRSGPVSRDRVGLYGGAEFPHGGRSGIRRTGPHRASRTGRSGFSREGRADRRARRPSWPATIIVPPRIKPTRMTRRAAVARTAVGKRCGVLRADEQRTGGEQKRDRDQSEPDNRRRVTPDASEPVVHREPPCWPYSRTPIRVMSKLCAPELLVVDAVWFGSTRRVKSRSIAPVCGAAVPTDRVGTCLSAAYVSSASAYPDMPRIIDIPSWHSPMQSNSRGNNRELATRRWRRTQ